MANNNKVYNINAMRPAFVKMRENGNRGVITKSVCSELGISETFFEWYKKSVESLFEAVCSYCRLKNSPKATAAEVDARAAMENGLKTVEVFVKGNGQGR